eukprot:g2366.t1
MLGWEGFVVIFLVLAALFTLFKDWAGADFIFLGVLSIMMVSRIVSVDEALAGFSNTAPLTVAVLFAVATGISETGCLDAIFDVILGNPGGLGIAMIRMMLPVTILSAFMNNTPVVAIMIPIVKTWCQKADLPPGQLYIPLSFASMLGGTCTLIGTSTNLVISGLMEEESDLDGGTGFFDIGKFGIPVAIGGLIYMFIFSPLLLPGRSSARLQYNQSSFLVGLEVPVQSRVVGCSVDEAGLRGLDGLYLASVRRGQNMISAIGPEFVIAAHDILYFTGIMSSLQTIADLYNLRPLTDETEELMPALLGSPRRGAKPANGESTFDEQFNETKGRRNSAFRPMSIATTSEAPLLDRASVGAMNHLLQAQVAVGAPIVGQSVKAIGFRSRFKAAILAISRNGDKVPGSLGGIVLQENDTLILDCGQGFDEHSEDVTVNLTNITRSTAKSEREFMVAMEVMPRGPLVNKTIEKANLRGLPQLYLVEIERATGHRIPAVSPTEVLKAGDVLWFTGVLESVASLRKIPGLVPHGDQVNKLKRSTQSSRLVEAVLAPTSVMVGKTVRESQFRTRFHAVIIGVHRQGHRLKEKIGDIRLRGGDVLLLDTSTDFVNEYKNSRNFALVSEVADSHQPRFDRALIAMLALLAMVGSQLLGVVFDRTFVELIVAALLAAAIMLIAQCMTGDQARASVKWDVIITIAAAFGVSAGIENSEVAKLIADSLVSVGKAIGGDFFVMCAMYFATMILSNLVANNAAAALMFPIAMGVARQNNIKASRMSALLMLAASSAFMSPFGYQTNLMVFASGGYTIMDFVKFGAPMQLWQAAVSLTVIFLEDEYLLVWFFSFLAAVLVFSMGYIKSTIQRCFGKEQLSKTLSTNQTTAKLVEASTSFSGK